MKPIKTMVFASFAIASLFNSSLAQAQDNKLTPKKAVLKEADLMRWSHLDLAKDTIPGMSIDKAYAELLKGKKGSPIIVGVIDSGLDIDHEDLKGKIWVNKKEIAGNGIDDDKKWFC